MSEPLMQETWSLVHGAFPRLESVAGAAVRPQMSLRAAAPADAEAQQAVVRTAAR